VVSDAGDVKGYDTITTQYDANGKIEQQNIVRDNGVEIQKLFDAPTGNANKGQLTQKIMIDGSPDEFKWAAKQTDYASNGQVEKTDVLYDDGDRVIRTFDGGDPEFKIMIDGADNDASYLYRVISWDEDGDATLTDYNELPTNAALAALIQGDAPMI